MEAALILVTVVAVLLGGAVIYLIARRARSSDVDTEPLLTALRGGIAELQQRALQDNSEQFLTLADARLKTETARGEEQLKSRQRDIDTGMRNIAQALEKMTGFVQAVDKKRSDSILELATVTTALMETTSRLDQALAGGQTRGQWGERMAEDVLRVAGFIEGVNFRKNRQIDAGTTRPDFTFLLPQERVLHMDVKFPLAGYLRFLEADTDSSRTAATKEFLTDVRQRIKEVTTRDYIDPGNGTLDYMLVFIPNEQVYGFIHQQDASIADEALRQRVVLCSPLTLFAVLAVMRQAMENFRLEQHANEILAALGAFNKQWTNFKEAMDGVGRRIEQTQKAYDIMSGTRVRQLDRQVTRVERLRQEAGIEAALLDEGQQDPAEIPPSVADVD